MRDVSYCHHCSQLQRKQRCGSDASELDQTTSMPRYGERLNINLMSVYPSEDIKQIPWDFIKIVPCKPEQLLFVAFPLAVLYKAFKWCPPIKKLLLKNKILKAYSQTDAVLDEAGISFADSRGAVMNTYAFVCAAVPMLMGVPVSKIFPRLWEPSILPINRFLAKWILPKMKLICARGKGTLENFKIHWSSKKM